MPGDDDAGQESEGPGPLGGLDDLLSQAMAMQQEVMAAQAQAADVVVEGQAGGGAVRVRVTGGMQFEAVEIAPSAVDPDDVEMLQDLVLAALHDAVQRVNDLQAQSLGGFGELLGASGLGDMLGVGGAPGDADDDDFEDDVIDVDAADDTDEGGD